MSSLSPRYRLLIVKGFALAAALTTASRGADSVVIFNEVQYHPAAGGTEWVELRNLNGVNVDVSGWRLSSAVDFRFPEGIVIPGHGFLLVAANPAHPSLAGKAALGPFTGSLANSGETLRLRNQTDRIMDEMTWSDGGDWPVGADGSGSTLARTQQGTAAAGPENWTASPEAGGTPKASNFAAAGAPAAVTQVISRTDNWKARAENTAPPAGWKAIGFDDSTWTSGAAAFYAGTPASSGAGEGLLAWWPLNETTGTTAANAAPGGAAASLQGATWINDAIRGRVLSLEGASDYVAAGATAVPVMTLTNDFTWAFHAWSGETGTSNVILGNRYSPSGSDFNPREFIKFTPGQFEFHRNGGGENIDYPDLPTGSWVHHAVVKKGASITYYRNGTTAGSATITQPTQNPQPLYFGGDRTAENWSGRLDDVALWTKALPASSVAGLASGSFTPLTTPTDPDGGASLTTALSAGSSTFYFRKTFSFSGNPALTTLTLEHLVDDGAVFHLNGVEIQRVNLPAGAVSHGTLATGEITDAAWSGAITLPGTALVSGTNVLAVEVHQQAAVDPDMLFAASLSTAEEPAPLPGLVPGLVLNEITSATDPAFRVELANEGTQPVVLTGWTLRSSSGASVSLPAQSLAAGGFLSLDAGALGFTPLDGDRLFLIAPDGLLTDARAVTNRLRGRLDGQWLYPASSTPGTANAFAPASEVVINEIMYHARPLAAMPGTPATYGTSSLLGWNAVWRYLADGSNPGDTWETVAHPAGGGWLTGTGPMGYESSPGVPVHPFMTTLAAPAGQSPFVRTYFFESGFTLTAAQIAAISALQITHEFDDGAIIHLNGTEVHRFQMPAEPVTAASFATGTGDAVLTGPVVLPGAAALLVPGLNRISVEVHQGSEGSSDVVFALSLEALAELTPAVPAQPFRDSDEQWIELYNKGTAAVDLAGWKLGGAVDFTFLPGASLAPGGYLVVSGNAAVFTAAHPGQPLAGVWSGNLSGSGERIDLLDAAGNPADTVDYHDGGRWPEAADGAGSSLELRDPRSGNQGPDAWASSNERARTAWQTVSYTSAATNGQGDPTLYNELILGLLDAGEILLDDISVIEDPNGTARQLIQNGNFSGGTTSSWRMLGTHRHTAVIDDPDSPGNKVLHLTASGSAEHMHNHAETTLKSGASFVTINSAQTYRISYRVRWLSGSNLLNSRLYFNRAARTTVLNAPLTAGTPGLVNSTHVANAGPGGQGLIHAPAVPAAGQAAVVSVELADPDGIAAATLFYAVNGGAFTSTAMANQGGGAWTGTIPAQGSGAKVQFYVRAVDVLGAESFLPAGGPDSRAMVPWADGQANLDYGDCQPNNLRIVMTTADADFMHTPAQVMSNDRIPCTIIYNESQIYYGCGVRLKGSQRGRPQDVRVGYSISFPPDQLFLGAHGTIAVDRSGSGDQFSQKEILIKHAINHAGGIPGMEDDLIRIIAPRSTHTGSAILLKSRFDKEWSDNQYDNGSDGRMFEYELIYYATTTTGGVEGLKLPNPDNVSGVAMRTQGGLDKELYRWHWLIDSNKDADDYSGLIGMLEALGLSGTAFRDTMDQRVDVDQWLRAFAVQALFGMGDSYSSGSQHNLLLYFRPDDGKAMYFPWDMDFAFSNGATSGVTDNGDLGRLLAASPAWERAYYGHLRDIITTTFNTTYMTPWAQHYSCFLPTEDLTGYLSYINTRRTTVLGLISAAVAQVPYRINSPDGTPTSQSTVLLQGDAWVDVAEIRLASTGLPLILTWTDDNSWQASVPVPSGNSVVVLNAYDRQGNLIGSDTVQVSSTSSAALAGPENLAISEIMYHPADPTPAELAAGFSDADDFEFIEVANLSAGSVALGSAGLTDGVTLTLPASTLPAGGRAVIVKNAVAFRARYGTAIAIAGEYGSSLSPSLSNAGEHLQLNSANGVPIAGVEWSDTAPWPAGADGAGYSMVLMGPGSRDPALPQNWRHSQSPGGSPGADDAIPLAAWMSQRGISNPLSDDDLDGETALAEYTTGGEPDGSVSPGAQSGSMEATTDGVYFTIALRVRSGADGADVTAEFANALQTWNNPAQAPPVFLGRMVEEGGFETIRYRSGIPAGPGPQFLRFRFTVGGTAP
ncbi:MAG: lamin tail domain-containing protein [Verrucomicrobiota bacterium]